MNLAAAITKRIRQRGQPWVFMPKDFLDLGAPHAVGMTLLRLVRRGNVRRLARGLYDCPKTHPVILVSGNQGRAQFAIPDHEGIRDEGFIKGGAAGCDSAARDSGSGSFGQALLGLGSCIGGALYSPTLATGGWNNLGGSITATDSSASASDSINSDGQRFYRVVLLP